MTDDRDDASPRSDARKELASKLALILVDKVVFGLLIVLAGFMLDSILERNRAETAFENEIAKVRVEKVAVVWAALDTQQLLTDDLPRVFNKNDCTGLGVRRFDKVRRALDEGNARFIRLLATNRFWLGEELSAELEGYARRQSALAAFLWQKWKQWRALLQSVLDNFRQINEERARAGRPPIKLPETSPKTPDEMTGLSQALKTGGAHNKIIATALCSPTLTPSETGLFGEIKSDLRKERQDVADVMARFVG